jgi:hypothetical protein
MLGARAQLLQLISQRRPALAPLALVLLNDCMPLYGFVLQYWPDLGFLVLGQAKAAFHFGYGLVR